MSGFIEGEDRRQHWLLPNRIDDYVSEDNQVRVIEAYVDELDLAALGFDGTHSAGTGRPRYHPATLPEDLSVRLPQPRPVEPPSRAGGPSAIWS